MERAAEQIKEAIAKLREMKPNVQDKTFFGDSNHAAIEAQIWVLENEPFDEDEIDEEFDSDHEREHAYQALGWLSGEDNNLVEGWQELIN